MLKTHQHVKMPDGKVVCRENPDAKQKWKEALAEWEQAFKLEAAERERLFKIEVEQRPKRWGVQQQ
jgi:hypothetical protein